MEEGEFQEARQDAQMPHISKKLIYVGLQVKIREESFIWLDNREKRKGKINWKNLVTNLSKIKHCINMQKCFVIILPA